ncbi:MAG: archaetidylserine decarboxylase [Flavobacteriales bacterium]|jgi:phosphatidylserine decarboxylase|nr:archaetidylserine decarboxylase [Flavobacteriales bacterium]MDG1174862.1 archaetidylserine decarboxylase [Flavobacteriales bacterium]|tara:strand:- start:196 stop:1083 length:888 start_codon:yes stop_codon:yes gene_type:complete
MEIKYINRSTGNIEAETPPAEGLLKFLYSNELGKRVFLPLIKRKFITAIYGRMMDKKSSTKKIEKFVSDLNIDMSESQKGMDEFTSFNDFFYRKLKLEAREIKGDFVSPGDGRLLAFENVNDVSNFFIKGRKFTLSDFLNSKDLAKSHKNSSMVIVRLAPNDYHRYHFPCEGTPSKSEKINGFYYSVSPYAVTNNFAEVFCENKREICSIKLPNQEEVLIIPVGATMVGSISSTYQSNEPVKAGDEMGYFSFGGSTVVLLFPSEKIKLSQDLLENTKNNMETFVKMGESIGEVLG